MNILDWEYYNSHFPKLTEEEFHKVLYQSSVLVYRKLALEIEQLTEDELTMVKDCICNVINYTYDVKESQNVSSVSNDGYSVSYVQKSSDEAKQELDNIYDTWLGYLQKSAFICF